MASFPINNALNLHNRLSSHYSPRLSRLRARELSRKTPERVGAFGFRENARGGAKLWCRFCKASAEIERFPAAEESDRPPFDINLAVILAGFAFEAYSSPPENVGRTEVDAADCKTVLLSESFVRELYDGQVFLKLKEGLDLPAMDPWGTSDPYVIMELDGQVVKSSTKWGQKEPKWDEEFTFHIKLPPKKILQVAAWDANLITPHKRMGNGGVNLESLCDGNLHDIVVELEGMGGGGKLKFEVKYKTFEEIEKEKEWWKLPFVSDFLRQNGLESALKKVSGSEAVQARQFVKYAFGQLKSFNNTYIGNTWISRISKNEEDSIEKSEKDSSNSVNYLGDNLEINTDNDTGTMKSDGTATESDKYFWKNFADIINRSVVQKLGIPTPDKLKWDGFDLLNSVGQQSKRIAEAGYVESGLAIEQVIGEDSEEKSGSFDINALRSSIPEIKKATEDIMRQTDSVLGALMVLTAAVAESNQKVEIPEKVPTKDETALDENRAEEMKELFSSAETAMEAWAMLATSLGQTSFIKSEFEKICFLDNESTDTQVAIWRDSSRKRLVVAFRGTEQTKWKDLKTDLMLIPAGLNPERIGGDFKEEVQVHSGFLSAYDSVRIRIVSLIKQAISCIDDEADPSLKWHVYVTGHSLGGALATLLALELSSSQLAKRGVIRVTMYNFGSPRVGNKRFAELYNQKVRDSWRVVNHRDIIPTVPRLMGYCHVAQPVYLATGDLNLALENLELLGDGYLGDVIGESTPDVLVNEFMKGEKELVEKILQTEINIFRSIRDGSALMQHMEDFYYITLLENVRSNYSTEARSNSTDQDSLPISRS